MRPERRGARLRYTVHFPSAFSGRASTALDGITGMLCPSCKQTENKVIDSRLTEGGLAIRRRRVCLKCSRRFTTKERVEEELRLTVIKAGGQRVPYNRDNVVNGILRACAKLEVSGDRIHRLVDRIEGEIFNGHEREITTEEIGQYVGKHLRRLSAVAYVRFMSVHRKFATVDEFVDEISDVRKRAAHDSPDQQALFEA
ncbi:MAG: transcriptional regulator NrdR [Phycisphaerales bacterium]|nr:transcriptional regulator NrdR [Phycisphaerales bacterium]